MITAHWRKLAEWLDAQTLRERALILAVALVFVYVCSDTFGVQPLVQARAATLLEREGLDKSVGSLASDVVRVRARAAEDPDAPNRARERQLSAQVAQLDAHLAKLTIELIAPNEMPDVLRGLLREQPSLRLVRLESLPVEALRFGSQAEEARADEPAEQDHVEEQAAVFKHAVQIELRGTYEATLAYLESIESLPWRFFWDDLEYDVEQYPEANIKLRVYSLSTREGWIGV